MNRTFSFQGRTSREEFQRTAIGYGLGAILLGLAAAGLLYGMAAVLGLPDLAGWPASTGVLLVFTLFLGASAALMVRRLHDIGASGWWALPWFVCGWTLPIPGLWAPILGIVGGLFNAGLALILFLRPGTRNVSRYGEAPSRPIGPLEPLWSRKRAADGLKAAGDELEAAKAKLRSSD